MSKFVDKVKKSGETYEIHDTRLEVTAEDAGKMVAVDEEGNLSLVDAPSGGTKLYLHTINNGNNDRISIVSTKKEPYTIVDGFGQNVGSDGVLSIIYYREADSTTYLLYEMGLVENEQNQLLVGGFIFNDSTELGTTDSEDLTGATDTVTEL